MHLWVTLFRAFEHQSDVGDGDVERGDAELRFARSAGVPANGQTQAFEDVLAVSRGDALVESTREDLSNAAGFGELFALGVGVFFLEDQALKFRAQDAFKGVANELELGKRR